MVQRLIAILILILYLKMEKIIIVLKMKKEETNEETTEETTDSEARHDFLKLQQRARRDEERVVDVGAQVLPQQPHLDLARSIVGAGRDQRGRDDDGERRAHDAMRRGPCCRSASWRVSGRLADPLGGSSSSTYIWP